MSSSDQKSLPSKAVDATVAGTKKMFRLTKGGFRKGRRFVLKKMGKLSVSASPEEYNQMREEFDATKNHYKLTTKAVRQFCKESASFLSSQGELADLFAQYGAGQDSALGQSMCKFAETLKSLNALRESFHSGIAEKTAQPMIEFMDNTMKETQKVNDLYKKQKDQMDDLTDKLANLRKKSSPDPVKVSQTEKKLEEQEQVCEGAYHDVIDHYHTTLQQKDFEYLEQLLYFMDAHYNLFADGYAYLHELKPYLDGVRKELDSAREASNADDGAEGADE